MRRPFDPLKAHGCAIYQGEKQVATTAPCSMTYSTGEEWPTDEDIARAKLLAAGPAAFNALLEILSVAPYHSGHGVGLYAIPDEIMDKARGALLIGGIER